MEHTQKGSIAAIVAIIAGVVVLAGVVVFNIQPEEEKMMDEAEMMIEHGEEMMEEGKEMMEEGKEMMESLDEARDDSVESEDVDVMMEETVETMEASIPAEVKEFNRADYDEAVESGKLVVLFFYANWCPKCKVEFPRLENAIEEFDGEDVVGFRVHYRDGADTTEHKDIAREFGVSSQHTKIFVKDGERVLKTPATWNQEMYLEEIKAAL